MLEKTTINKNKWERLGSSIQGIGLLEILPRLYKFYTRCSISTGPVLLYTKPSHSQNKYTFAIESAYVSFKLVAMWLLRYFAFFFYIYFLLDTLRYFAVLV